MGAPDPMFSSLTPAERNLIRLIQSIDRGRLHHLTVCNGQPSFEAPLTAVRLIDLRRPKTRSQPVTTPIETVDFALRREVMDLIFQIRAMKYGMIERLEVLHGLPTSAEVAEPLCLSATTSTLTRAG